MTYGQLKSYDNFKKLPSYSRTGADSQKLGVGCIKTNLTAGQWKVSRNITLDMPTWPAYCRLTGHTWCMITHYRLRIQNCLISANLKSIQEALAFLIILQSLENLREQYRSAWRDFKHQDQNHRTLRDRPIDSMGNHRPSDSGQVHHVRHDGRDRNPRGADQ